MVGKRRKLLEGGLYRLTLSIPKAVYKEMIELQKRETNWSAIATAAIKQELESLKRLRSK